MSNDKLSIGIAVSKYNSEITDNLLEGAQWVFGEGLDTLGRQWWKEFSSRPEFNPEDGRDEPPYDLTNIYNRANINIKITRVPGAYELPFGAQCLAKEENMKGVIALGAIIQGETSHHDHIAAAVSHGLMQVSMQQEIPVGFGLITANTYKQAVQRAAKDVLQGSAAAKQSEERGESNKGYEAAKAVLEMLLEQTFSQHIKQTSE